MLLHVSLIKFLILKFTIFLQRLKTVDPTNYQADKFEPLYLLYFSENSFESPHYQSIRPNSNLTGSIETSPMVQEYDHHAHSVDNLSAEGLNFDDITPPICESTAIDKSSSVWAKLESQIEYFSSVEISEDLFSFGRKLNKEQSPYLAHGDCPVSVYIKISRNHFTIRRMGNSAFLEDHSAAGTYVRNKLVGKEKSVQLKNDDIISIGDEFFVKPGKKAMIGFKFIQKFVQPQKRLPNFDETTVLESTSTILEPEESVTEVSQSKRSRVSNESRILRSEIRKRCSKLSKSGIYSSNMIIYGIKSYILKKVGL